MENCLPESVVVVSAPDLSEGQFLYEIFCPEMAGGSYPIMLPWKRLNAEQQEGWQRVACLFKAAL